MGMTYAKICMGIDGELEKLPAPLKYVMEQRDKVFEEIYAIDEELRIRRGRVLTPKYRNELKLKLARLRGIAEGIDFAMAIATEGNH